MKFHVLTLFPELIGQGMNTSILGRAVRDGVITVNAVNIRDFTQEKHGKVDDYTYGGGAGMLMQAQPVYDAWRSVAGKPEGGARIRTVYLTPQGERFSQRLAEKFSQEEELIFLCGHYEGIDERVLEEIVTDRISIGDYVLTGGELPALVMMDAIARMVPGVLHNRESALTETFHRDLLEYPQYSRPEVWRGKPVPEVLLSGNQARIEQWRLESSLERTRRSRPDLYEKYLQRENLCRKLLRQKRDNVHMIEALSRGIGEILYESESLALVWLWESGVCQFWAEPGPDDALAAEGRLGEELCRALSLVPADCKCAVTNDAWMNRIVCETLDFVVKMEVRNFVYTENVPLPVRNRDVLIRTLSMEDDVAYVEKNYRILDGDYLRGRIRAGALWGAFVDGKMAGFAGRHDDGSLGLLFVDPAYRRMGLGGDLEAYSINRERERGHIPYGQVEVENAGSLALQEKMGLYASKRPVFWLYRKEAVSPHQA